MKIIFTEMEPRKDCTNKYAKGEVCLQCNKCNRYDTNNNHLSCMDRGILAYEEDKINARIKEILVTHRPYKIRVTEHFTCRDYIFRIGDIMVVDHIDMNRTSITVIIKEQNVMMEIGQSVLRMFDKYFEVYDVESECEVKMSKKELSFNDLALGNVLVSKKAFEYGGLSYRGKESFVITILDDSSSAIRLVKNKVELKMGMLGINKYFRLPKSKNVIIKHHHDDVELAIRNGDRTIVLLKSGAKGISICDDNSVYCEIVGYTIAYAIAKKHEATKKYKILKAHEEEKIKNIQVVLADDKREYEAKMKKYDYIIKKAHNNIIEKPPMPAPPM